LSLQEGLEISSGKKRRRREGTGEAKSQSALREILTVGKKKWHGFKATISKKSCKALNLKKNKEASLREIYN